MSFTATAIATIQFVGLVLFSRELTPDRQLIALMPRIEHSRHTKPPKAVAINNKQRTDREVDPATPVSVVSTDVEEHAAFIAFPAGDYLSSKGWAPVGLETVHGYLFLRLDGEHISFVAGGERKTSTEMNDAQPYEKKAKREEVSPDTLRLPHLQPCCKDAKLKPEFQYPHFRGAVAVFNLPSLKVRGCNAVAQDTSVNSSRVDSRTAIENGGVLIISATKNGRKKEIRLRGNTSVIVAHLPSDAVTGQPPAASSARHFQAYYDMIEQGSCSENYKECAIQSESTDGPCKDKSILREIGGSTVGDLYSGPSREFPWEVAYRTDFECSNSQWP